MINRLSHALVFALSVLFCGAIAPASNAAEANLGLSGQLFIVDHSGSMGGRFDWVAETVQALEARQRTPGNYGLMEFSKDTRAITFDGELFGRASRFGQAVNQLKRGGGMEDGYLAINTAIRQYGLSARIAPHIVLLTDEHRTAVQRNVDVASLSAKLAETQIPVSVVVNVRFICEDKSIAFGMNSRGMGIVLDTNGAVGECPLGRLATPSKKGNSITDYVDLALSTGGTAWDVLIPRSGARGKADFANVFSQVQSQTLNQSLEQLDVIPEVSYFPSQPKVGDVVTFNARDAKAVNAAGSNSSWQWDFNSDRQFDMNGPTIAHVFDTPGWHEIKLAVSSSYLGRPNTYTIRIKVGE